jgi:hypothetical protein
MSAGPYWAVTGSARHAIQALRVRADHFPVPFGRLGNSGSTAFSSSGRSTHSPRAGGVRFRRCSGGLGARPLPAMRLCSFREAMRPHQMIPRVIRSTRRSLRRFRGARARGSSPWVCSSASPRRLGLSLSLMTRLRVDGLHVADAVRPSFCERYYVIHFIGSSLAANVAHTIVSVHHETSTLGLPTTTDRSFCSSTPSPWFWCVPRARHQVRTPNCGTHLRCPCH